MRYLPQRRITVLLTGLGGALLAGLILRITATPLSEATLLWLCFGGAVGALAGACVLLIMAGGDRRLLQLRELHPDAVVEQMYPTDDLDQLLVAFTPWLQRDLPPIMVTMTIVMDGSSFSLFTGSRIPSRVLWVPWSDVAEFGVAPSTESWLSGRATLDRLVLRAHAEGSWAQLLFGVERTDRFAPGSGALSAADLAAIVGRVARLRNTPGSTVARPGIGTLAAPVTAGLTPGLSARSVHRVALLGSFPLSVLFALCAVLGGLAVNTGASPLGYVLGALGLLAPITGFIAARIERSARRRERTAGYTTLNGRELDLQQRHPFTGAVLRQAGHPPIDEAEFRGMIGR